jgi:hypothetical protein
MNNHDDNRHDSKAMWLALSGVTITLASAFSPPLADEPTREPVQRLTPTPTVAVSSAPSVRASSVAFRI